MQLWCWMQLIGLDTALVLDAASIERLVDWKKLKQCCNIRMYFLFF